MPSVITLIFLLCFATTCISESLENYTNLLELENSTRSWVEQTQPTLSPADTSLIANHLLFNAAAKHVPLELLVGLVMVESRLNPKAHSSHGAKGIAQVMPKYHRAKIKGRDLFDPRIGLDVGTQILSECLTTSHGNKQAALMCYSGYRGKQATHYQHAVFEQSARFKSFITAPATKRALQLATIAIDSKTF